MKKRDIPKWSLYEEVTMTLIRLSKKFLDGYIHEYPLATKLGVLLVDLMDQMIEMGVNLVVTYDLRQGCCHLFGEYELLDTKYLGLPPDVDTTDLSPDRARQILEYVISLVRFNNRLLLRDEQYWREMEVKRKIQEQMAVMRSVGLHDQAGVVRSIRIQEQNGIFMFHRNWLELYML